MKKLQVLILGVFVLSIIFSGCVGENGIFSIVGDGKIVKQTLSIKDFDAIESCDAINIIITQGDSQEVIAEGNQNIIDRLETEEKKKKWNIDLIRGNYGKYDLTIYITIPTLRSADLYGSGNIKINKFSNLGDLSLSITGSGDIETDTIYATNIYTEITGSGSCSLKANAQKIDNEITGSGEINLLGNIINQIIEITGSGQYFAFDCVSESSDISISGSGDAQVFASKTLNVEITGSGNVLYKGEPIINQTITGSGDLINKN